jgi:GntR family transcriptional regulator
MISIMESKHDNSSDKHLDLPLYEQIKRKILVALEHGVWNPGELIPSEVELANSYHVSSGTIRKALDELVAQHILIRRQGSGTFVATHQEEQSKYRFLHLANNQGKMKESTNKILLCSHQKAPEAVYAAFEMHPDDIFVHIRRLMSFNQQPIVFEDIWLPCPLFEGLNLELLLNWTGTLYGLIENHFGIHMIHAKEQISAVMPTEIAREYLQIDKSIPVLDIFRTSYSYGEKPIEVRQAQYVTMEYHYLNHLS